MARSSISLSFTPKFPPKGYEGPWKIRWRENVIEDGMPDRQARSLSVTDKGARDALMAKIRRQLEAGEVYEPDARVVTTPGNLELAALAWLRWQASRDRKGSTRVKYKSAIARIMGTIRRVRGIKADAVIPVTVLDVELFAAIRNIWIAEDTKAITAKTSRGAASPMRRYHLSGFLYAVWSFAASQPNAYSCVPALVDRGLVIPPVPAQPGAPEAPTWAECDAVVRRAYAVSTELGDALAGERYTGLRVEQLVSIRRRAIDPVRCTLTVEVGKSAAEQAEMRTVPIPPSLVEVWQARIAVCKGPDAFLFPSDATASGHVHLDTPTITRLWKEAEAGGELRANLVKPLTRRKGRPNHAFRAAYMAGLQSLTVEVDGTEVQRVSDRTIDYLVGHRPMDTRARHYTPPTASALSAAVKLIPPIETGVATSAGGENIVSGPWRA